MTDDFDRWLEGELPSLLPAPQAPVATRYLAARGARPRWRRQGPWR